MEHNAGYGIGVVCFARIGVKFGHIAESILLVGVLWDGCRSEARNTGSYLTPADDANLQCVYSAAKTVIVNAGWKAKPSRH